MQHRIEEFVQAWILARPIAILLLWFVHANALAQDNVWTNASGGLWESPSWSLGQPGGSAIINNAGNKTILIGPSTWANYSNSLDVSPFNLSGTVDSTNRLLIDGGAAPIVFRCTGQIGVNGVLDNRGATLQLFSASPQIDGTLLQSGGILQSSPLEVFGQVRLTNTMASIQSYLSIPFSGEFQQVGGTLDSSALIISGTYRFDDGVINGGGLYLGVFSGGGRFYQDKGTLNLSSIALGTRSYVIFSLSAGSIFVSNFSIGGEGSFTQQGGSVNATNELTLIGSVDRHGVSLARYALTNGLLFAKSLLIDNGEFIQSGGTNYVADTRVGSPYDSFPSSMDRYVLLGGQLIASNISVYGTFTCEDASASITNAGYFQLAGFLQTGGRSVRLGSLKIPDTATIDLGGSGILRFADSSGMTWGTSLIVKNWDGSLGGGGNTRLLFGTNSAGLTPNQVNQVKFVNPGGLPNGTYSAKNLSSGEVIPDPPGMFYSIQTSNIVLTWFGSNILQSATEVEGLFVDHPEITSPYTNIFSTDPRKFFRLKP